MDTHSPKLLFHKKNSSLGDKRIADKISKYLMKVHSQDLIKLLADKTEQVKKLRRDREEMLEQISLLKFELNSFLGLPSLASKKDKKLETLQTQLKDSLQQNQHLIKQLNELQILCSELLKVSNIQPEKVKILQQKLHRSPKPTLHKVKTTPNLAIESPVISLSDEKYKSPRFTVRKSTQEKTKKLPKSPYKCAKTTKNLKKSRSIDYKMFKTAKQQELITGSISPTLPDLETQLEAIKKRTEGLLKNLTTQTTKEKLS